MLLVVSSLDPMPLTYEGRVQQCKNIIALHETRMEAFKKAKRWTYASLFFDGGCVGIGSFLFVQTARQAREEASFVRAITGNPFVRRAFTPFPFFSSLLVITGLAFIPPDLASLQMLKEHKTVEDGLLVKAQQMLDDLEKAGPPAKEREASAAVEPAKKK